MFRNQPKTDIQIDPASATISTYREIATKQDKVSKIPKKIAKIESNQESVLPEPPTKREEKVFYPMTRGVTGNVTPDMSMRPSVSQPSKIGIVHTKAKPSFVDPDF